MNITDMLKSDLISVCICTYKRPEMLERALNGLAAQVTEHKFSFEVIVVDNDHMRSGADVVEKFQEQNSLQTVYDCEPEQNISMARNRAVRNANGNLIAFIDDDEFPVKDWLSNLYHVMQEFDADGALGPVLPFYQPGAPKWVKKGKIFDRRRFPTGTRLNVRDTRTGNVLLARSIFAEKSFWFDPAFGRTGGEDVDFFGKQIVEGRVFVWCDEAIVYETIPPERLRMDFHLKKWVRIGCLNGERLKKQGALGMIGLSKTMISVPAMIILLLLFLPFGKHCWIQMALKLSYSASCILAYFGYSLLRYRD